MPKNYSIDMSAHYFCLMHPLEGCITPWCSIIYTSNNTREKWVECVVDESDEYSKIILKSIEPGYGTQKFYKEDFVSFLNSGHIVKKIPGMECVEEHWLEPLNENVSLHHSAYMLKVKTNKRK